MRSRRPRVLFVDDDRAVLRALAYAFADRYEALTAESGEAALELVRSSRPDVVVCDQRMPGRGGADVCADIGKVDPDLPRAILTAYADMSEAARAVNEGGVTGYFQKPFSEDELVAYIDAATAEKSSPEHDFGNDVKRNGRIDPEALRALEEDAVEERRLAVIELRRARASLMALGETRLRVVR